MNTYKSSCTWDGDEIEVGTLIADRADIASSIDISKECSVIMVVYYLTPAKSPSS